MDLPADGCKMAGRANGETVMKGVLTSSASAERSLPASSKEEGENPASLSFLPIEAREEARGGGGVGGGGRGGGWGGRGSMRLSLFSGDGHQ